MQGTSKPAPVPQLPHGVYRAVCAAVALGLAAVVVDLILYGRAFRSDLLMWGGLGLMAGPLAWLERHAGEGWRGRASLGAWCLAAAFVGTWLIGLQSAYSEGFLSHATWSLALEAAQDGAWLAAFDPLTPAVLLGCAIPFAVTPLLRTTRRSPWLLAVTGGFVALAAARPLLRAVGAWGYRRQVVVVHTAKEVIPTWGLPSGPQATEALVNAPAWTVARYLLVMLFLAGVALPLAYALADRLAERWGWGERDTPVARSPSKRPWGVVLASGVLVAALALHTQAHPSEAQVVRWVDFAEQGGRLSLAARALERIDASDLDMVPALLKQLRAKQAHRRRWGVRLLGRIGPQARRWAYEPVLAATSDPEPQVALEALRTLGRLKAREAIGPLIEVFMVGGGGLASQAAEGALAELDFRWSREHVEVLLGYFGSHGWRVERQALRILGQLGPEAEAAVVPLAELLAVYAGRRRRWTGRDEVLEALAAIGPPTLAETRRRLAATAGTGTTGTDWELPAALLGAVGRMKPSLAVWEVLGEGLAHDHTSVRSAAAWALEDQLDRHGSRLPRALHGPSVDLLLRAAADEQVRGVGLGQLRSWAVPYLLARLQGDGEQHAQVVMALGSMSRRNRKVDAALLRATRDEEPAVRIAAAEALGLRFRGDHDRLHAMASEDPDPHVRRAALLALGSGGVRRTRTRKRLRSSLDDESLLVRVEAAQLLAGRRFYGSGEFAYVEPLGNAETYALRPFLPRLIAVLIEALRHPETVHGQDHTPELLLEVGQLAEPVALPALGKVVADRELALEMRVRAVGVLNNFHSHAARQLRLRLLEQVENEAIRTRLRAN